MQQGSWWRFLILAAVGLSLAACDPFAYYPGRSRTVTPPPGAAGQPPAPPPAAAAPPATLAQQVRDLQARVQQLETRLAEMEGAPPAAPVPSHRAPERPTPEAAGAPKGYPAPAVVQEKLYVEGYRLYQSKKYAAARNKFGKYLRLQPRGAKAPEARYYLAFSFQHEGKYREAAVEFNKLANQFPRSNLAPAALLQQALAYKNDNRTKLYQTTLHKLVKTHPRSPEAREAQRLLKEGGR